MRPPEKEGTMREPLLSIQLNGVIDGPPRAGSQPHAWRTSVLIAVCLCLASSGFICAGDYDAALGTLPLVTTVKYTTDGRIHVLEGELSHPSTLDPIAIATAFMSNRSDLYPRASGSTFIPETRLATEDPATISMIQVIDGYHATDAPINVAINPSGIVTSVSGSSLRLSDLPSLEKHPVSEEDALKIGREALRVDNEVFFQSARLVLRGVAQVEPAWRCTIYFHHTRRNIDVQATLDVHALDGEIIDYSLVNVTGFIDFLAIPATRPAQADPVVGCVDLSPSIGDFTDGTTVKHWNPSNFGDGHLSVSHLGTEIHANTVEPPCTLDPGSPCNSGALTRSDLSLPPGLSTARLFIRSPMCRDEEDAQISLRWGPAEHQAYEIDVTDLCDIRSYEFEIPLWSKPSWKSEDVTSLTIEIDRDIDRVTLVSLDLRAGPWVAVSGTPEIEPTYGNHLTAGVPVRIEQTINNLGCELPLPRPTMSCHLGSFQYPFMAQRQLRIQTHRMIQIGQGWQLDPGSNWETIANPRMCFPMDAESHSDVELVSGLSGGGGITFDSGHWLVEITHPNHDGGTTSTEIDVEPAPVPDVIISNAQPVDLIKEDVIGQSYRVDTLTNTTCDPGDAANTKMIFRTNTATTDTSIAPSGKAEVYLRRHNPLDPITQCPPVGQANWIKVGEFIEDNIDDDQEWQVQFSQDACTNLWSAVDTWDLLDLWIQVVDVDGEINTSNNSLCVNRWIPAARAANFGAAIGDVVVESDYWTSGSTIQPNVTAGIAAEPYGGNIGSSNPNAGTLSYSVDEATGPIPIIGWTDSTSSNDGYLTTAALIRYRREHNGLDGLPHLGGGADEAQGSVSQDPFAENLHHMFGDGPHRVYLDASNQWHTAIWRRGSLGPFGQVEGFANFATDPGGSEGHEIGVVFHPDSLPCPNDRQRESCVKYPTVYIDGVWIWKSSRPAQPTPLIETSGLWHQVIPEGTTTPVWVPFPERLPGPAPVNLAVGATNSGDANYEESLTGTIEIFEAGQSVAALTGLVGDANIPPGGTVLIPMGTAWAATPGSYTVSGQVLGTSNPVIRPLEVYTPIDITMNRAVYETMSGDWVDLASAPAFPREYPVELAVIVHNTGTDQAPGFLYLKAEVYAQSRVLVQTLESSVMILIPGMDGLEPGTARVPLFPQWSPNDGQSTILLSGTFNDEPIGNLTYNPTAEGCPVPYVTVP
jgi:hypothetical protein